MVHNIGKCSGQTTHPVLGDPHGSVQDNRQKYLPVGTTTPVVKTVLPDLLLLQFHDLRLLCTLHPPPHDRKPAGHRRRRSLKLQMAIFGCGLRWTEISGATDPGYLLPIIWNEGFRVCLRRHCDLLP
jgi:hypothetical protein